MADTSDVYVAGSSYRVLEPAPRKGVPSPGKRVPKGVQQALAKKTA